MQWLILIGGENFGNFSFEKVKFSGSPKTYCELPKEIVVDYGEEGHVFLFL